MIGSHAAINLLLSISAQGMKPCVSIVLGWSEETGEHQLKVKTSGTSILRTFEADISFKEIAVRSRRPETNVVSSCCFAPAALSETYYYVFLGAAELPFQSPYKTCSSCLV